MTAAELLEKWPTLALWPRAEKVEQQRLADEYQADAIAEAQSMQIPEDE